MASLDKDKLDSLLQDPTLAIEVFETLPSTQDYLQNKNSLGHFQVCLAEEQTQGRGRLGRPWHSSKGRNIYCSFSYSFHKDIRELSSLSLAIGILMADVLGNLYPALHPRLKWPNDLYVNNKKLGGILVEIHPETGSAPRAIIGFGLNVNMKGIPCEDINQPWTSLEHSLNVPIDRNHLIAQLFPAFRKGLDLFEREGFTPFLERWKPYDFLEGREIALQRGTEIFKGVACGITPEGYLCLHLPTGEIHPFSSGEARVLKNQEFQKPLVSNV